MADVYLYPGATPAEDVKLYYAGEIIAILKEIYDSLYGSDSVTADKDVMVADSMTGVDAPYRDWMPTVLDVLFSSDLPYVHKQVLVTDILQAIEETPTTPEKIKFVTDLANAIESFYDVWKGKWDEPIQTLYQSLRDLQVKLVTEKNVEVKTKEP